MFLGLVWMINGPLMDLKVQLPQEVLTMYAKSRRVLFLHFFYKIITIQLANEQSKKQ